MKNKRRLFSPVLRDSSVQIRLRDTFVTVRDLPGYHTTYNMPTRITQHVCVYMNCCCDMIITIIYNCSIMYQPTHTVRVTTAAVRECMSYYIAIRKRVQRLKKHARLVHACNRTPKSQQPHLIPAKTIAARKKVSVKNSQLW